jgi:hypothetical protein
MNDAQRTLSSLGIQPRPDFSNHDTYKLRHRGDLDALRIAAHDEGPASVTYARYMAVLQQGLDETLPSADMLGAIPMSIDQQTANLQRAQRQTQQRWTAVHPLLTQLRDANGTALSDLPAESAHQMAAMLAADGHRQQAQILMDAISYSESSSIGVEFIEPDEEIVHHVMPDQRASDGDAYSDWRAEQQRQASGIQALQIQNRDVEAALLAGTSSDGLSYSRSDDWSHSDG